MPKMKAIIVFESVVPFAVMVLLEGCTIALTITANVATQKGMNQFVFVAYTNALSSIILLPYSFFFHKQRMRESFNLKLVGRFFILGVTGITVAQNLAFTGLRNSSPIVVCAMGLLLPSFQFLLALCRGRTKLDIGKASSKIRVGGMVVSFLGAAMVIYYKGPSIVQTPVLNLSRSFRDTDQLLFAVISNSQQWIFGCLLLASATFFLAIWGTLQVSTYKKLPDMMVIVTWYIMFGTIQTAVVDLLAERDLSAWKLSFDLELVIIVLTAFLGTFGRSRVQAWCMNKKGAMYVASFKPFGILWACAITLPLFGNGLHYGSVVGASISGVGYYAMLWAATVEEEEKKVDKIVTAEFEDDQVKAPLLQIQHEQV